MRALAPVLLSFLITIGGSARQETWSLLVSSRNTHSVKRFDGASHAFAGDLIAAQAGGLSTTQEILLAPDGRLLVSGRGNPAILAFDARSGAPLGEFTRGYALDNPTKMTWGPDGHLYVSQWGERKSSVARFAPDGRFVDEVTPRLNQPMQHLWDEQGRLYVVSFGSRDVRRFRNGQQIDVFISDSLQGPVNLWRHADGDLLVADWEGGAVRRFDARTGTFLGNFITGLANPEGWAIGPDSALYIAEWTGNRIKRFDRRTGALLETFGEEGGLQGPNSLLFVRR